MRARRRLVAALLAVSLAGPPPAGGGCEGCVTAGAASVPLRLAPGTPLAGYGSVARRLLLPDVLGQHPHAFWFRPHEGELDPVAARALVLESAGRRLVWVGLDLIAVDRAFTARVARALDGAGLGDGTLILSASHTHSGPGAFIDSRLFGAVSVEREDPAVRDGLVADVVEAVRRAHAARGPARVGVARGPGPALTTGRLGHPVDREIGVIKIVDDRATPVAAVWNFAIHGTMLGSRNLRLSGDITGVASREIERALGAPALFVNGAVGDVSPQKHGLEEMRAAARVLAAAVQDVWQRAPVRERAPLRIRTMRVALPPPALSLRNCVGPWVPRGLRVPLGAALPGDAELTAVALGDAAWVTIPGELQSRLGERVKQGGVPPWAHVFVAGVSNDYLGYFLTPDDYDRVTYVACASLYGPESGDRLTRAAVDLLRALADNGR